jgi:hypothetical protein
MTHDLKSKPGPKVREVVLDGSKYESPADSAAA